MSFYHSMTVRTEGIRPVSPVKWRSMDGMMSVFWDAEGQSGATGYYFSPDPRIVVFFNDVSSHILMSNLAETPSPPSRPMTRAIYVPAGLSLWTSFVATHRFSHFDLHLHEDRLVRHLSLSVGRASALSVVRRPAEIQNVSAIETLGGLLVNEMSSPTRHVFFSESLVSCIAAALLDIPGDQPDRESLRLGDIQMARLTSLLQSRGRRLAVGEMAEAVGLSESRFTALFKQTTGQTPSQWQLANRVDFAKELLTTSDLAIADIAAQLGFSDQAHLTRIFRKIARETPAAWRRMHGR